MGIYGDIGQPDGLPEQDMSRLLLLAERWQRAAAPHEKWATVAKQCVDFLEDRQWTDDERAMLRKAKRPALTFNKISPLVRLVLGYFTNNRTEIKYLPSYQGLGQEDIAELLTRLEKATAENNGMEYVDAEVFLDGIVGGRGFYDDRLSFENNDFGDLVTRACDPFSTYIDPDAQDYDLNKAGYIIESSWASPDMIGNLYGQAAADLVAPLSKGYSPIGPVWATQGVAGEITPQRRFGREEDGFPEWWNSMQSLLGDYVDPLRQNIRLLNFQYHVTKRMPVFVDLETGDRKPIPDDWDQPRIQKVLYFANEVMQQPVRVQVRPVQRIRWTAIAGDLIVHDDWSPYETYTVSGFFPYFRRGQTKGMVEALLDPQREINKRRTANIETVMRQSNSGWMYHENALDEKNKLNLKKFGASPGIHVQWKGDQKPSKIEASPYPEALAKLEGAATDDIRQISGINESALGELDRVQSGRAIEARQRQAVIALQMYLDNFSRTKKLQGRRHVEVFQDHYTEERIFRIEGKTGDFVQLEINKEMADPTTGAVTKLNDISLGKYTVSIDETPLSADFANAQFEEAKDIMEWFKNMGLPILPFMETLIDLSTMPRKDEIKQDLRNAMGAQQPGAPGGAPGGPMPPPGGAPAPGGPPAPSLTGGARPGAPAAPGPH